MKYPFLFIALDYQTQEDVFRAANELASIEGNFGLKINLNILLKNGLKEVINQVKQLGKPIFADLKMFLGERTMVWIAEDIAELKIEFTNIHLLAGLDAVEGVSQVFKDTETNLLGLTVPTHYDETYCQKNFGKSLEDMVLELAAVASEAGCNGIILPPPTLKRVGASYSDLLVVPAIRVQGLPGFDDKRHAEAVTPRQAIENGANILVCGTPITKSRVMAAALQVVLSEMY